MKVFLSAHQKYYIFRLAEYLDNHGVLSSLVSIYPKFKVKEYAIDPRRLGTISHLGALRLVANKLHKKLPTTWFSNHFDAQVIKRLRAHPEKPDIFHGLSGYCLESLRWAKRHGIKTVLDRACPHVDFQSQLLTEEYNLLHGTSEPVIPNELREKMIAEYDEADIILVPSRYTYNSFIQYGYSPQKLRLAPLTPEKQLRPSETQTENKKFIVFSAGFNFYRKGFYYLMKAWESLDLPNAELIIRNVVPDEFRRFADFHSITLLDGHVSNEKLAQLYQNSDVFALLSVDEGFGMVGVEAMSAGKPIIVTENVGMADVIVNGKEGFVIPIRDVNAAKEAILKLYEDQALRVKMAKSALETAQRVTVSTYGDAVLKAYKSLWKSPAEVKVSEEVM